MVANERDRVTRRPPKPCSKRHHHRARRYPMDEQALIKEMEDYFFAWAKGEGDINHTVLVDLYELEHHSHPATFLKEAQEELLWQVQQGPEMELFYLLQRRKCLPIRSEVSHPVTTSSHAQRKPTIERSQRRQNDKILNPGGVVVPAPAFRNKSSAPNPAKSRTFTMPLRQGVQAFIRAAFESDKQNHGFLVLRSRTPINRANFFGRYQGQRADL
ncbi:hypothetical protein KCU78_g1422, partial [Aureobasidium melanogenum]